jgi:ABC-type amino acid transport system permease subunit
MGTGLSIGLSDISSGMSITPIAGIRVEIVPTIFPMLAISFWRSAVSRHRNDTLKSATLLVSDHK